MKALNIASTNFSPTVECLNGEVKITGKSVLEDAASFFEPLHLWLKEYIASSDTIKVEFNLTYFNSTTAKQILKFLMAIDDSGIEADVTWVYPADNEILLERGQEYGIMLDLKIKFKPV